MLLKEQLDELADADADIIPHCIADEPDDQPWQDDVPVPQGRSHDRDKGGRHGKGHRYDEEIIHVHLEYFRQDPMEYKGSWHYQDDVDQDRHGFKTEHAYVRHGCKDQAEDQDQVDPALEGFFYAFYPGDK